MKKYILLVVTGILLCSHDMYLKLDSYILESNVKASILLYNGTFERSDNTIDRNRMIDVSLVGNGSRTTLDTTQWTEIEKSTVLNFTTGEPGTWVAGVSTRARNIEMEARAFNDYLEHDGVIDMLEWRKNNDALDQDAVEKYSKHVKTIFQVGETLTSDWKTVLGYPIEFIPLANPYDMHPGHAMSFELLLNGEPLGNQLVYIGTKTKDHSHDGQGHFHGGDAEQSHSQDHSDESSDDHSHGMKQFRTDANGVLRVNIDHEGIWYLRTIHLVESDEGGLTHESNWATLTFEIGEGHSHEHAHAEDEGEHTHGHDEGGIPEYVWWLGSFLLVIILFFIFNRQSK